MTVTCSVNNWYKMDIYPGFSHCHSFLVLTYLLPLLSADSYLPIPIGCLKWMKEWMFVCWVSSTYTSSKDCGEPGQCSWCSHLLRCGRSRLHIPARTKDFSSPKLPIHPMGPTQPPIQWVQEFLPGAWSWSLHLVLRLRMSGAIPLHPLYAFVAGIGKGFSFLQGL